VTPKQTYEDEDFVNAIKELPRDLAATSEVRDAVGCSFSTAEERLDTLAEKGKVRKTETRAGDIWRVADA